MKYVLLFTLFVTSLFSQDCTDIGFDLGHAGDVWGDAIGCTGETVLFDSENPTGGDHDLEGHWGNILIIQENAGGEPDDCGEGGTIILSFDPPVDIVSIPVIDIEETGGTITGCGPNGEELGVVDIPVTGNNGYVDVHVNFEGVSSVKINLTSSGAIDDFISCESETVLPVGLMSFSVDDSNSGIHKINWAVSYEVDMCCYTVESSTNGQFWEDITTVGIGKAHYGVEYSPRAGRIYYRLRIIDLDGTFTYSNIIDGFNYVDLLTDPFIVKDARVTDVQGREINIFHRGIFFVTYKGITYKILRLDE